MRLRADLREYIGRHRLGFVLGTSTLVALAVPLTLGIVNGSGVDRPPYVVVEAKTELARFRVIRHTIAKIGLVDAKANVELPGCAGAMESVTGLLEPEDHALVTYRTRSTRYSVQIESGDIVTAGERQPAPEVKRSRLVLKDGTECVLPASVQFTSDLGTKGAADKEVSQSIDLPIAGPAELGAEMGSISMGKDGPLPMTGLLREGKVRIFGRAGFWSSPALHTVADSEMSLPAGARLSGGNIDSAPSSLPPWYGVATFKGDHLSISASTVSAELFLFGPGVTGDVERLGLRMITRLLNDPGLALLLVGLATFAFAFQILAAMVQLAERR